ncbi:EF-hand domain-containing protein [Alphaproteobacteria bacterium]|nr:EF-hand domain-containing protein [Alphaproteobacteria bacterium]
MMVWVKIVIFCLTFLSSIQASELSQEEIYYFNIMDLNNDGYVSTDEINQSVNIIFQLIDTNNDNKISLEELEELKEIVNILK